MHKQVLTLFRACGGGDCCYACVFYMRTVCSLRFALCVNVCVVNIRDMLISQKPLNGGSCEAQFIIYFYLRFALHVTACVI